MHAPFTNVFPSKEIPLAIPIARHFGHGQSFFSRFGFLPKNKPRECTRLVPLNAAMSEASRSGETAGGFETYLNIWLRAHRMACPGLRENPLTAVMKNPKLSIPNFLSVTFAHSSRVAFQSRRGPK